MAVRTRHFHLLDGMRGIAAGFVLWFHLGLPKVWASLPRCGFLLFAERFCADLLNNIVG